MEIIIHRVNTIKNLKEIPSKYGIEIDIRANGSNLILNHEPFQKGQKLIDFLKYYNHGTIIANIKEAGIEYEVINLFRLLKIKSFFLLDTEMPFVFKCYKENFKKIALRYSEYEKIENIKVFKDFFDWVWIDTITKLEINKIDLKFIKNNKSCLVCPERWGRPEDIKKYKRKLKKLNFKLDAVMTSYRYAKLWEQ